MKRTALIVLAILLTACVPEWFSMYKTEIDNQPLTFTRPNSEAGTVWTRANEYIQREYENVTSSELAVTTKMSYGSITAAREIRDDSTVFRVTWSGDDLSDYSARKIALYMDKGRQEDDYERLYEEEKRGN